jgi:hypothetical protein
MFPEACRPIEHTAQRCPPVLGKTALPKAARKPDGSLTLLQPFFTLPMVNARQLGGSLFIEAGVACE